MDEQQIYTLRRVLSVKKQTCETVEIVASAICKSELFSFIAAACTNVYIILRYSGSINTYPTGAKALPIVRYLPWTVYKHHNTSFNGNTKASHKKILD
jgi:hypothetical protein